MRTQEIEHEFISIHASSRRKRLCIQTQHHYTAKNKRSQFTLRKRNTKETKKGSENMVRDKANRTLRLKIAGAGVYMADIAAEIGIAPSTLSIWMSEELTEERRIKVEAALDKLMETSEENKTA